MTSLASMMLQGQQLSNPQFLVHDGFSNQELEMNIFNSCLLGDAEDIDVFGDFHNMLPGECLMNSFEEPPIYRSMEIKSSHDCLPPAENRGAEKPATIKTQKAPCPTISKSSQKGAKTKRRRAEPRKKSQEQLEKMRERNRILARRTRLRKKVVFETLQTQVTDLKKENAMLKAAMNNKGNYPSLKKEGSCDDSSSGSRSNSMGSQAVSVESSSNDDLTSESTRSKMDSARGLQSIFCITDPTNPECPIIYVSHRFLDVTGFKLEQVVGKSIRFLQGPETEQTEMDRLVRCLRTGGDESIQLMTYKADGSAFWNHMHVESLRDKNNRVVQSLILQFPVSSQATTSSDEEDLDELFDL